MMFFDAAFAGIVITENDVALFGLSTGTPLTDQAKSFGEFQSADLI
jgi:hypothetical protein